MLISKVGINKWNSKNKKTYIDLGYTFTKWGDEFEVIIEHLTEYSNALVDVECDYCGKIFKMKYSNYLITLKKTLKKSCCPAPSECHQSKAKEAMMIKYGVNNIFKKSDYMKEKNMEKHGGIFHTQTDEFKNKYLRGDKNRAWKGGTTKNGERKNDMEEKRWRRHVYKRDSYTCQCCGDNKGGNLNAHHLYSYTAYPSKRYDLDNGITLCSECHKKFHKIFGNGDNTLNEFNLFIALQPNILRSVQTRSDECNSVGVEISTTSKCETTSCIRDEEIVGTTGN